MFRGIAESLWFHHITVETSKRMKNTEILTVLRWDPALKGEVAEQVWVVAPGVSYGFSNSVCSYSYLYNNSYYCKDSNVDAAHFFWKVVENILQLVKDEGQNIYTNSVFRPDTSQPDQGMC